MKFLISIIVIGVGATVFMDLWTIVRTSLLGIAAPNYGLVGRWIGHMPHGRFHHMKIANSDPIRGETLIGWTAHYLIGIAFAGLLIGVSGQEWLAQPTLLPALAIGFVTVLAPFLIMQPGMGAGFFASRTPNPGSARLHSLITHLVFGLGLYLSGTILMHLSAF